MQRIVIVVTIALSCFAFVSGETYAMEMQQIHWRGHKVIEATGEVVGGDTQRFTDALSKAKPAPDGFIVILLNSPGGSVSEALRISALFSHFNVHAVVPRGSRCASACASIIFVAAKYRTVEEGGLLGQHSCFDHVTGEKNQKCNEIIAQHALNMASRTGV